MKKTLIIVLAAWLLVPTGTPDDVIALALMKHLGMQLYIFMLVIVALAMYHYHITPSKAKKTMGSFVRRFK